MGLLGIMVLALPVFLIFMASYLVGLMMTEHANDILENIAIGMWFLVVSFVVFLIIVPQFCELGEMTWDFILKKIGKN